MAINGYRFRSHVIVIFKLASHKLFKTQHISKDIQACSKNSLKMKIDQKCRSHAKSRCDFARYLVFQVFVTAINYKKIVNL